MQQLREFVRRLWTIYNSGAPARVLWDEFRISVNNHGSHPSLTTGEWFFHYFPIETSSRWARLGPAGPLTGTADSTGGIGITKVKFVDEGGSGVNHRMRIEYGLLQYDTYAIETGAGSMRDSFLIPRWAGARASFASRKGHAGHPRNLCYLRCHTGYWFG